MTARTFATLLAGAIILALAPAASAQQAKDDDALEKLVKARGGFSFIKRDETQAGKPVIEVYINAATDADLVALEGQDADAPLHEGHRRGPEKAGRAAESGNPRPGLFPRPEGRGA